MAQKNLNWKAYEMDKKRRKIRQGSQEKTRKRPNSGIGSMLKKAF